MKSSLFYIAVLITIFIANNELMSQSNYIKINEQGITSETHRINSGKIVWAKQRIKFDNQDNIKYSDAYDGGDAIYGRGYLEHCLYNYTIDLGNDNCLNPESLYELKVKVNDEPAFSFHNGSFPNQEWTTFQINLALTSGDSEDGLNQGVTSKWAAIANKLPKGTHRILFEFWAGRTGCELKKYAEGSFTYNKLSDSKLKGSGPEVPQPSMINQKLEKEMLEAVRNQGWKDDVPIDVVILESDWRIIRDGWGNITDREINTFVIIKNKKGECNATDISFRQPYNGKSYGKTQFYGLGMKKIPVTCSDYSK
jgi:hypothetical protein